MDAYQYNHEISCHMLSRGLNPNDPNHRAHFINAVQQAAQQPMYAANRTGTPVNIKNGFIRTEARGIFVSGLNYRADERAISAYFAGAGPIVSLDLQRDHQTKKFKGNCTIHFDSAKSAQKAITMFHATSFMNMKLHVREDKERTAIDAPSAGPAPTQASVRSVAPPVIVSSTPTHQVRRVTARVEGQR